MKKSVIKSATGAEVSRPHVGEPILRINFFSSSVVLPQKKSVAVGEACQPQPEGNCRVMLL
jgi:hypothetical protein